MVGLNTSAENIVSQRENHIEVLVHLPVMQAVLACQKFIDRPPAEHPLLWLVHLQMNLVPRPVVKNHNVHEDRRPMPGDQCNNRGERHSLDRRLTHRQPYLLVFPTGHRGIAEYLGVVLVMHKSVRLKYAFEGRGMRTEEVSSMHQLPVYLMLYKGRQDARENEPATNLQNKHQPSLDPAGAIPCATPRLGWLAGVCRRVLLSIAGQVGRARPTRLPDPPAPAATAGLLGQGPWRF